MVTSLQEYRKLLYLIQSENAPQKAILLPGDEPILNIDLDTRTIEAPKFLSVATDHTAETVYFKVNRYFDNVDLTNMTCLIQYVNAAGESGIYVVPFYDTTTLSQDNNIEGTNAVEKGQYILFPWVIEGAVTKTAGKVQYSIQFFKMRDESGLDYSYNLNTLPVESEVLKGSNFDELSVIANQDEQLGVILDKLGDEEKLNITYINNNLATAYYALVEKLARIQHDGQLEFFWEDV